MPIQITCQRCGIGFSARPSSTAKFCSRQCFIIPWQIRFWKYVEKSDGCWNWTGNKRDGYGQLSVGLTHDNSPVDAHRLSWILNFGEIPEGLEVCHHCDNHSCVRPDHLFLGTRKQNAEDCVSKMRQAYGVKNGLAKLDDDAVREIRALYRKGFRNWAKIAPIFGVSNSAVGYAARGQTWKHVA
jgi:hypothetical protein